MTEHSAKRPTTPPGQSVAGLQPLLSLRGLGKHYGAITALADVSFDVHEHEVVALAGDNGAGKSTLVKIISGIVSHDEGDIFIDGSAAHLTSPQDAAALGIQTVYQDLALCDNLDTVQNLYLGREIRGGVFRGRRLKRDEMEYRARESLLKLNVKIRDYRAPVGSLSGGQRQSVAVARAVLWDPRIVLLDEPTAALGVPQRREVLALIDRLREQGRGVIFVSHDLVDVQEIADRVVVLRLGRKADEFTQAENTNERLLGAITGVTAMAPEANSPRSATPHAQDPIEGLT